MEHISFIVGSVSMLLSFGGIIAAIFIYGKSKEIVDKENEKREASFELILKDLQGFVTTLRNLHKIPSFGNQVIPIVVDNLILGLKINMPNMGKDEQEDVHGMVGRLLTLQLPQQATAVLTNNERIESYLELVDNFLEKHTLPKH